MNTKRLIVSIISILSLSLAMNVKSNATEEMSLSDKQKSIVRISSYTARGKLNELNLALNEGFDAGLTINEIKEVLVQLYAYCGFPRSLQGINTLMSVLEERKAKGINDNVGNEATLIKKRGDKYERGKKVLEELTGQKQTRPVSGFGAFSPEIDIFLKEHLFADIFKRDVLSYFQRELVTIAALASMNAVEPMLQSHLYMGMNVGLTESQLEDLFSIIKTTVGISQAENGRKILEEVIRNKNKT